MGSCRFHRGGTHLPGRAAVGDYSPGSHHRTDGRERREAGGRGRRASAGRRLHRTFPPGGAHHPGLDGRGARRGDPGAEQPRIGSSVSGVRPPAEASREHVQRASRSLTTNYSWRRPAESKKIILPMGTKSSARSIAA